MKKTLLIIFLGISISLYSQDASDPMEYVKGDVLVMIDDSRNINDLVAELRLVEGIETGLSAVEEISPPANIWKLNFDHTAITHINLLRAFWQNEHVLIAQNNHICQSRAVPNDPSYSSQWHHSNIDSEAAWDITTGGQTANGDDIVVAILEGGGATYNHTDLDANHWTNADELDFNGVDDDNNGYIDDIKGWNLGTNTDDVAGGNHGTSVSGMTGAVGDNSTGVTGANWDVGLMQIDMQSGLTESNVIAAYTYPLVMRKMYNASGGTEGAFVVATNASWGIDGGDPASAPLWCAFYDTLGAHGILNCGATTNNNWNVDVMGDLPTACGSDYMISVTATNSADVRTFSGYGATTIDLGAPGESVYTTDNGGYGSTSGTSFASPLTAGVIALMYSAPCSALADLALVNPWQAADIVRQALLDGTDPVAALSGECVTGGRLNSKNAIDELILTCGSWTSTAENDELQFNAYPNPATVELNLVTYNDQKATFRLYDNLGKLLHTRIIQGMTRIDVSTLAGGIYVFSVQDENGNISTDKLVVE
jgi:hypothetical protein